MKSAIVAYDMNRGIGANNDLLWGRDLPKDLERFKYLTLGSTVVMGRLTYESIGSRPLPGRENVVVTSSPDKIARAIGVRSLEAAYEAASNDVFIIGGERMYQQALNDLDQIYATEVQHVFPAATSFFPALNESDWQEFERKHVASDENNQYSMDFVELRRRGAQSIQV